MLTINYNNTDLSLKLEEFSAPSVAITLLNTEEIWIGYKKPISNFHIEISAVVTSLSNVSIQYENSSGLVNVANLIDRTYGLGNSGKISWDLASDAVKSTKFGKELYWYSLSVNISTVARSVLGINVIYSGDADLAEEYPGVMELLPENATSFINFHASSRKDIVQKLRGKFTANGNLLTQFDLLNNEEVKQASKYLTLSKIFAWLSDAPGDKWSLKSEAFYGSAIDYLNNVTLTIDSNDNGTIDQEEKNVIQFVRVVRV